MYFGYSQNHAVTPFSDILFCGSLPSSYVTADDFSIYETEIKAFKKNQNANLVLNLPAGFEFNPGVGSVSFTSGKDITSVSVNSITSTAIDIQIVTDNNAGELDAIIFSGFQIRAVTAGVSGDLYRGGTGLTGSFNIQNSTDNPGDGTPNTAESLGYLESGNNMSFVSSTSVNSNTTGVSPSVPNAEILRIEVVVTDNCSPFNVTQFDFNTDGGNGTGTTDPSSDLTNASVYYTGTSSTFSTSTLFGSQASPNGGFSVSGSQELASGTNYFWLAYDISSGAVVDNLVDASCTSIVMDGGVGSQTPTETQPVGSRYVQAFYSRQTGNFSNVNTWSTTGCGGAAATSVPGANDKIVICSGNSVTLDGNKSVNSIVIEDGGVLNDDGGARALTISSDLYTTGAGYFDLSGGGILTVNGIANFQGSGNLVLAGVASFDGSLEVGSGVVLRQTANQDVTLVGDLTCDGTIEITGNRSLKLTGSGTNISGTGSITSSNANTQLEISGGAKSILAGSSLTIQPKIYINANSLTVTNYGDVMLEYNGVSTQGDLDAKKDACVWVNSSGATLVYEGRNTMFGGWGNLNANASGNTVNYASDIAQTIILPTAQVYHHLTTSGAGIKTAEGDLDVNGDVLIDSDFDTGTNNLKVAGNWTNNSSYITGTGTVEFDGNTVMSGTAITTLLDVNISGSLTAPASGEVIVQGNWNNTGTFVHNNAKITLSGSGAQTMTGSNTFYDLEINNASGVSVSSGAVNIENVMTVSNGAFATNNALTILSTASRTGCIAELTTGSVSGSVTMQRYYSVSSAGWSMLATPITTGAISDWGDDIYNTWIFGYDETQSGTYDEGWVGALSTGTSIAPGSGFMAYTYSGTSILDVTGPVFQGSKDFGVTYTDDPAQPATEDGWNLLGNPYPASLDWDAAGWTKSNVNDAIYIWDESSGQYSSYISGVGTNGGSNLIGSSQAFWVQTNGSSPQLVCSESCKSTSDAAFFREVVQRVLKLQVQGSNGKTDETVVRLDSSSTDGFDNFSDALKLYSTTSSVPNMSTSGDFDSDFSVNSFTRDPNGHIIPLKITVGVTGTYTVTFPQNTLNESIVYLEDLVTGAIVDLNTQSSYTFTMNKAYADTRFRIYIGTIPGSTLPIELTYFKAEINQEAVDLIWETASEENNEFFTIERSADGRSFKEIGKVKGAGNSSTYLEYQLKDKSPLTGYNYYRLKQTDTDGKFSYSKTDVVYFENTLISHENSIHIWPNPAVNSVVNISCEGFQPGEVVLLELRDMTGNLRQQEQVQATDNGSVFSRMNLSNTLSPGVYFISSTSNENTKSERLIIK